MSGCLGRTLNNHLKYFISTRYYSHKFSVLCPIHNKINANNTAEKRQNAIQTFNPVQVQHRNFSLKGVESFYSSVFNSVTQSDASRLVREALISVHDLSGLPWWGTIIALTAGTRLLISFPCGIYQQYLISKIKLTNIDVKSKIPDLKEKVLLDARRGQWSQIKAQKRLKFEVQKLRKQLLTQNNCHPFKCVILSWSQIPVLILLSLTLRKMAMDVSMDRADSILMALQFKVGGVFWSPNLTQPDDFLIIPLIVSIGSLLTIELNLLSGKGVVSFLSKFITNCFRFFAILSFPVSMMVPSCVSLYWATSVVLALAQSLLFLSPKFRRFSGIPKVPGDLEKPYSHVGMKFKEKYFRFRKS